MFIAELETGSMKSGSSFQFSVQASFIWQTDGRRQKGRSKYWSRVWCIPCKWAYSLSCYSSCIRNSIFVVRTVLPASLSQIPLWKKGWDYLKLDEVILLQKQMLQIISEHLCSLVSASWVLEKPIIVFLCMLFAVPAIMAGKMVYFVVLAYTSITSFSLR